MAIRQVKQFVVGRKEDGADFTVDEIATITAKIAYWFTRPECDRAYENPAEEAQRKIQQCLLAETDAGDPWRNCPKEFAARVRAKCNYDITTDKGIPSPTRKRLGGRVLDPAAKEGAREVGQINPATADFDQAAYREQVEKDILEQWPELDNPAHKPLVKSISMYHTEREKIDRQLAIGVSDSKRETLLNSLRMIAGMLDSALQQLGIHPNQIKKNIDKRTASSVGDLVAQIEEDEDFRHREKTWALQLALQLWWMSEHPNGKKTGPQLSDFEIWHMTRSRPIKFTCRHGETYSVVEGFVPKDLHDLLVKEKVLVEEPVIPKLIKAEDLEGLNDYFTTEGADGTDGTGRIVDSATPNHAADETGG